MSIESSQALHQATISSQMMSKSLQDQIPVSTREALNERVENTTLEQVNVNMSTISAMDIPEHIASVERITPSTSAEAVSVGTQEITDVQTLASVENENQTNAADLRLNGEVNGESSPHTPSLAEISMSVLPQTQDSIGID